MLGKEMVGKTYNGGGTLTDRHGQLIGEPSEPYFESTHPLVVRELPLLIATYRLLLNKKKKAFSGFIPTLPKPLGPLEKQIKLQGGLGEWVSNHPALPIIQKRISEKARKKSGLGPFGQEVLEAAKEIEAEIQKCIKL